MLKRKELEKLAFIDLETGCYNKNYFNYAIENDKKDYYVVFVDINNLKSVIDENGHQCGEDIIYRVAQSLKHLSGKTIRYGWDEFLFITSTYTVEGIQSLMKDIQKTFDVSYGIGEKKRTNLWRDAIANADFDMFVMKREMKKTKTMARKPKRLEENIK